jgi:hypothetical protein
MMKHKYNQKGKRKKVKGESQSGKQKKKKLRTVTEITKKHRGTQRKTLRNSVKTLCNSVLVLKETQ